MSLTTGLFLAGLGLSTISANAAPAMPQPGVIAGTAVDQVRMDNHQGSMMRHKRRMNTMHHGNPNSRNPHQAGHMQQMGNTAGGPRH